MEKTATSLSNVLIVTYKEAQPIRIFTTKNGQIHSDPPFFAPKLEQCRVNSSLQLTKNLHNVDIEKKSNK